MSRRSKKKNALNCSPNDISKVVNKASFKAERKKRLKAASGTKSKVDSSVTFEPANPFLSIPTEIRLQIYGYLFLDPPYAKLAPTESTIRDNIKGVMDRQLQDANIACDDTESDSLDSDVYDDSDFDYGMFDPDDFNPYGIPMGDMCDGMFNEVYSLGGPMPFEDDMADYMDYQRHAADTQGLDSWFNDFTDEQNGRESYDSTDDQSGREGDHGMRDSNTRVVPKESHTKRYMAILRTNRQIYDEASALLRKDLRIKVKPGDALLNHPTSAVVKDSGKIWRYNPFMGLGITDTHGRTVYKSSALDGAVEPHVFAQFRKIHYKADFDFQLDSTAPSLYVDDDLDVNVEDTAKFASYLTTAKNTTRWFEDPLPGHGYDSGRRETLEDVADITISSVTITEPSTADIVQRFVSLLSNSPFIHYLEFVIDIKVTCEADTSSDSSSDSDDETDSEKDEKDVLKWRVAYEKGTELFLESGVLNSLKGLTNVMCFSPKVATLGRGETPMKLQQKHVKILRDLKEVIEKNWRIKDGSR
ncbi:hypothetical protein BDR22DRAFT_500374 [Usnea florida]